MYLNRLRSRFGCRFDTVKHWLVLSNCLLMVGVWLVPTQGRADEPARRSPRLSELQVIGTHNSYHIAPDSVARGLIKTFAAREVEPIDYTHPKLAAQFDELGIRQIELDLYCDPDGGHFARPLALQLAEQTGARVEPHDPDGKLAMPGIKILHSPDVDFRTTALTLCDALCDVRDWSDQHRDHLPIFILLELKSDSFSPATKPRAWDADQLAKLEDELRRVFPRDRVLTPDDVRRNLPTLREAIEKHGWPTLDATRGKVVFLLDNEDGLRDRYLADSPFLAGKLLFVSVARTHPAAAWMKRNDPINGFDEIQSLVRAGFLVRTRADANTRAARTGDVVQRDRALASGAQMISTDFPKRDPRFTDYAVRLRGGVTAQLNPVSAGADLVAAGADRDWEKQGDAARDALQRRLDELTRKLHAQQPAAKERTDEWDRWADVDGLAKAVAWGLRYTTELTDADRKLLERWLDAGEKRQQARAAGKPEWVQTKGRVLRAYRSQVDGSTQPFGVIVPASYDPTKPTRLDVVLHGSTRPVGMSEARFLDRFLSPGEPPVTNYIELHPLGRVENCYRWAGETDVFEAIEAVCRQYAIDRRQIVLRGMSMGASGTWHLGLKHPDRFAALGPYCGYVDTYRFSQTPLANFVVVKDLPGYQARGLHLLDSVDYAGNAKMVPAIGAMGEKDIFFEAHVLMGEAMKREGLAMVNLISPGTGHVIDPVTHTEQMRRIGEAVSQRPMPGPRRVEFVTWSLKYPRCDWVEIHGLGRHYERADVVASVDEQGTLQLERATNVTRLRFDVRRMPTAPKRLRAGGQEIEIVAGLQQIGIVREGEKWRTVSDGDALWQSGKRTGLTGPIDDAFTSKFLCVRGTGKPWNLAVQAWADARLASFADEWRRYFRGELPIKADVDVTPEDIANNHLVLWGDPGSNAWLAQVLPRLPLQWTPDEVRIGGSHGAAKDHFPVLIHPNPLPGGQGKYVVVNSGHTFGDAELGAVNYLLFPRLGDWAMRKVDRASVRRADPRAFHDPSVVTAGYCDELWTPRGEGAPAVALP